MRRAAALATVAAALVAAQDASAAQQYRVTVERDRHGVPTITGRDYRSVAYGYGRAIAKDNLCILADTYVTVRSVDTLVKRLRRRIEADPAHPRYLLTVWGVGYKFADL